MIKYLLSSITVILSITVFSQNEAVKYLESFSKEHNAVMQSIWDYTSTAAHVKNPKKIERKRQDLLNSIKGAMRNVNNISDFNGDNSMKNASIEYLEVSYNVINQDYGKVVDMSEIMMQSYDMLELFYRTQREANKKIEESAEKLNSEQKSFASKNNIKLLDNSNELSEKIKKANEVFDYREKIYLVYMKAFFQEQVLVKTFESQNIEIVKKQMGNLNETINAGKDLLIEIGSFNNDKSLVNEVNEVFTFFRSENKLIEAMTDLSHKQNNLSNLQKIVEEKSASERTESEVNAYNQAVEEYNKAVKDFNDLNDKINEQRTEHNNDFEEAIKNFMDKHVPN